jgi:4-hydroxy-3-polyprenylbenzoate decarboxylase
MKETIELLKQHNQLKIIDEPLDIYLEIPHVAYIEVKKDDSKAILFTNPIDKKNDKKFDIPVLMNVFANPETTKLFCGDVESVAEEIENLLHMKPPVGFMGKIDMFSQLFSLKSVFPKRLNKKGECQQVIQTEDFSLYDMPVLTTWEQDGGPFITMGQTYTTSIDGTVHNLGMYRLQIYDDKSLGLHWQIHKDSNHIFHEYKKANKKMPVSIAIGGDPLYIWCGQAPLPHGVFELMLYGLIRKEPAKLVKSITNDIYIPHDVDFVIEGFVDVNKLVDEGPFGDHTGYYTLIEPYPVLDVTCITRKKEPTFLATVVGKPPLEDKYMGYATEKIFFPLLKTTTPDLVEYNMPENGVFHNLILAKIDPKYPSHAKQIAHAFWGVGQMSFVKHAIFVDTNAPSLEEYDSLTTHILNRFDVSKLLISDGVCDALDHSSPTKNEGGKLGIDATGDEITERHITILDDIKLFEKISKITDEITQIKQYKTDTKNPILLAKVKKTRNMKYIYDDLKPLFNHISILIFVDDEKNDLNNPYMLVWRVVNNIDAKRDIYIDTHTIGVDATNKNALDNFKREWPDDVECTPSVIKELKEKGVIDIDDEFEKKFYL